MCALEDAKDVCVSALEDKFCWGNNTYQAIKVLRLFIPSFNKDLLSTYNAQYWGYSSKQINTIITVMKLVFYQGMHINNENNNCS